MSENGTQSEQGSSDDDERDGSAVESWLRRVAHAPAGESPIPLPGVGAVIGGKYRIEEELGRGGMGAVYRATHVVSDKQVALKWMLRPTSDERARERFTREARATGRIDHPNVVDVYDIGQDGDGGYLVMELLRGESLRHRLARLRLAPTAAVDLLLPAMRGVAAAHREGVIHRDLKPDNIFLCRGPEGGEREAKVLDFGISTIYTAAPDAKTTLTKEGTVLGTPAYMSPEQLESARDVDARTDVYAFGVVLYESLTGSVPFVGDSYSALVLAIANTKPRAPRDLCPEIPLGLERVVLRAMERDRAERIESMEGLIAALRPFASVESAGSGDRASAELPQESVPSTWRRRLLALGALLLVALGLLSWWLTSARPPAASNATVVPRAATLAPAVTLQPPPPAVANEPMAAPRANVAGGSPAAPGVGAQTPSIREPAPPHSERARFRPDRIAPLSAEGGASASAPATPTAPTPARARSGSIRIEDL